MTTPQLPPPVDPATPTQPVPVGQPVAPVHFFRRMPGGGTAFVKPPPAPSGLDTKETNR